MRDTDLFLRCVGIILKNEGGYVNHPHDEGGETNFGICKRNHPDLDIKNMTREEAIEIYRKEYWDKMNLDGIKNANLALHVFDMGVNAGCKRAIKILQAIVGASVDGIIGPETIKLVNDCNRDVVSLYVAERKKLYFSLARNNPDMQVFLAGWLNRCDKTNFA
jgi:lysozyme family protein